MGAGRAAAASKWEGDKGGESGDDSVGIFARSDLPGRSVRCGNDTDLCNLDGSGGRSGRSCSSNVVTICEGARGGARGGGFRGDDSFELGDATRDCEGTATGATGSNALSVITSGARPSAGTGSGLSIDVAGSMPGGGSASGSGRTPCKASITSFISETAEATTGNASSGSMEGRCSKFFYRTTRKRSTHHDKRNARTVESHKKQPAA